MNTLLCLAALYAVFFADLFAFFTLVLFFISIFVIMLVYVISRRNMHIPNS